MNKKIYGTAYISQAGSQWDGFTVKLPARVVQLTDSLRNGRIETFEHVHRLKPGERYEVGAAAHWDVVHA